MLNGIGANTEMWGAAEERLARSARTIAVDAPGTGRSDTPLVPLPMDAVARTLWRVLDRLGYGRVDVVGYSLGGAVAQQLAREAPRRVRRLALVCTACGWGSVPGDLPALAAVATPFRYYSPSWYHATRHLLGDPDLGELVDEHVAARRRYPPTLAGYAYQLWAAMAWSSLPWLAELDAPTLVVAGARDRLVPPANGMQLARLLPESRLHVLADEGHAVMFDPASRAHGLLADFFASARHDESEAWTTGVSVEDGAAVETALRTTGGAEPLRALSAAFRHALAVAC
jgi:pimeloyl-ACP methyl ester carboxylesterase